MKESFSDNIFNVINATLLTVVLFITLYPLIYILSASISMPIYVNNGEMWLLPKGITFDGYERVFQDQRIITGYWNTICYTVVGTVINLIMTFVCAYPLSRKDLFGRKVITTFITFTMFFGGGLIPTYLLIKNLGMLNSFWVMVIPGAISVWNVIIARTYFQTLPEALQEAAIIDGCNNFKLFTLIILPLSAPIVAVLALYYGIAHWNSFFGALIYISDRKLYSLQLILREILVQQQMSDAMLSSGVNLDTMQKQAEMADVIKYAVMIVASLPVLLVYPFLQKYFIKGILVGSIKG